MLLQHIIEKIKNNILLNDDDLEIINEETIIEAQKIMSNRNSDNNKNNKNKNKNKKTYNAETNNEYNIIILQKIMNFKNYLTSILIDMDKKLFKRNCKVNFCDHFYYMSKLCKSNESSSSSVTVDMQKNQLTKATKDAFRKKRKIIKDIYNVIAA